MATTFDALAVRERFEAAISSLTQRLQMDRNLVAAVLFGSAAYDTVWEKSDIDLTLITQDDVKGSSFTLLADDIPVHASMMTRGDFKKTMDRSMGGEFMSSILARSRLLFSRDEALKALWETAQNPIGSRDRSAQLMRVSIEVLASRVKAEKWLRVKRDFDYTAVWLLICAGALARLDLIYASQNPGREALNDALKRNPELFGVVYTGVLHGPRDAESLGDALGAIDNYLREHTDEIFGPVIAFLREAGTPRSTRELNEHFSRHFRVSAIDLICDYLVDEGILERVPLPMRLAKDSRVTLDEAGYSYIGA